MPHGILVARRVTLAFSHTPRRCFARPCVPTLLVPRHGRLLHAGSSARAPSKKKRSRDDEQAPDADFDTLWKEAAEVESKEPSPQKPEKDDSWLFDHAGPKISVLDGEVSTEGYDDFVTHEGGAKLISSWSIAPGDEPVMWVPGKPFLSFPFLSNLATREDSSPLTTEADYVTIPRRRATTERHKTARDIGA